MSPRHSHSAGIGPGTGDGSTGQTDERASATLEAEGGIHGQHRTGSLMAATWLIGLGIVFLVQRAADLAWSQAWPLFVILVGVASFVTAILQRRLESAGCGRSPGRSPGSSSASSLLASTTGAIGTEPGRADRRVVAVGA